MTYDSTERRTALVSEFRDIWSRRGLLGLLVVRNLTIRYKRSLLGVWWTALNPLLTVAIMFLVFSRVFRLATPGQPYVVYLLSGVLLVSFFSQGVTQCAFSIIGSSGVLKKLYVPPELFSLSAGLAAAITFGISLIPLLIVQLVVGVGVPWTFMLTPIPIVFMVIFITGIGLLVAAAAVYFYDIFEIANVALQLIAYLTPTFYPASIVPVHLRWAVDINPLFSFLQVFRGLAYQQHIVSWHWYAGMGAYSLAALLVGTRLFRRSWKNLVVLL